MTRDVERIGGAPAECFCAT